MEPLNLNEKTVFILGAGASKPYGLPLGTELKQTIIVNISINACRESLQGAGFHPSLINDFHEALPRTSHPTIDIFLEKKKKFRELGAYLIAYSLFPLEDPDRLFPKKNWYGYLYEAINFESEEPKAENIVFVTLNYDRSLEHFLSRNIHYDCADDFIQFAESKVNSLEIIHAHGSLGKYPEIPYEIKNREHELIQSAAEKIRIASDKLEDSSDFHAAQQAIKRAINIVFVGFGYDPTTLKLLVADVDVSKTRIIGTSFQLDDSRTDFVLKYFNNNIEMFHDTVDASNGLKTILSSKNT